LAHFVAQQSSSNSNDKKQAAEIHGNLMSAAIAEAIKHLEQKSELPLKAFYSEKEACKFLGKGPQFLKTLRASGKAGPKYTERGSSYIYSGLDLMQFAQDNGRPMEPVSRQNAVEAGLESVSLVVGRLQQKVERQRKKHEERAKTTDIAAEKPKK
jgi:hypothetical protein